MTGKHGWMYPDNVFAVQKTRHRAVQRVYSSDHKHTICGMQSILFMYPSPVCLARYATTSNRK
jgi:hypothetical protein